MLKNAETISFPIPPLEDVVIGVPAGPGEVDTTRPREFGRQPFTIGETLDAGEIDEMFAGVRGETKVNVGVLQGQIELPCSFESAGTSLAMFAAYLGQAGIDSFGLFVLPEGPVPGRRLYPHRDGGSIRAIMSGLGKYTLSALNHPNMADGLGDRNDLAGARGAFEPMVNIPEQNMWPAKSNTFTVIGPHTIHARQGIRRPTLVASVELPSDETKFNNQLAALGML